MKMILFILLFTFLSFQDVSQYYGTRYSISHIAMASKMLDLVNDLLPKNKIEDWPDVVDTIGDSTIKEVLTLSQIKTIDFQRDITKCDSTKYKINGMNYSIPCTPGFINYKAYFKWDFQIFGTHWFFGDGTFNIISDSFSINQGFSLGSSYSNTNTTSSSTWKTTNVNISSNREHDKFVQWITDALSVSFHVAMDVQLSTVFHAFIDPITNNFMNFYLTSLSSSGNSINNTNVLKSIEFLKSTDNRDVISYDYQTTTTLNQGPLNATVQRFLNNTFDTQFDSEICLSDDVFVNNMELLSKFGLFYFSFPNLTLGNLISDFFEIFPNIATTYFGIEGVDNICNGSINYTIGVISERHNYANVHLLIPLYCLSQITKVGPKFMDSTIFLSTLYTFLLDKNSNGSYISMSNGILQAIEIYNKGVIPDQKAKITDLYSSICHLLPTINQTIGVAFTLKPSTPFGTFNFQQIVSSYDHVCFYYNKA